jgi:hypothetical protein
LADDGTVFSFGSNVWGGLGLGTDDWFLVVPVATPIDTSNLGGRKITQIAAGADHSLLLADDGSVFSFGDNTEGATGLGILPNTHTTFATPIITTNLGAHKVTQISAGAYNSFVLTDDFRAFAFGSNGYWQSGFNTSTPRGIATPIDTANLSGLAVTQISGGVYHSLLIGAPFLPGDFNHDGSVDAADYILWRKNPGDTYTQADYTAWRTNFGRTLSAGSGSAGYPLGASAESPSATVPESSAIPLALVGLIGVAFYRARNNAPAHISCPL